MSHSPFALLTLVAIVTSGCAKPLPPPPTPTTPPRSVSDDDDRDSEIYNTRSFDDPPEYRRVATPKLRALGFDLNIFPAVDGSTSTQWLADIISLRALGIADARWEPYRYIGTFWDVTDFLGSGTLKRDGGPDFTVDEQIDVLKFFSARRHSQTTQAYAALTDGKADLLLIARGPTADESKAAGAKGVELVVEPVARDALVFVVNPKNPIAGLSLEQVRGIFAGRTTRWSDLGPIQGLAAAPIRAYVRERGSGSEELMRDLVMKDQKMLDLVDYRIPTMRGLINRVATQTEAIGYTVFYYQQFMSDRSQTRVIPLDGVAPDRATLASHRYPLTCDVLMISRKGLAAASPAGKLRAWLLSDEGQAIVRESGYVPVR